MLKKRHAVFTTCLLCCTDGTQTSTASVNKDRLSLTVLLMLASLKTFAIFRHEDFLKIHLIMVSCLPSETRHFKLRHRCELSCTFTALFQISVSLFSVTCPHYLLRRNSLFLFRRGAAAEPADTKANEIKFMRHALHD